jgi:uncharacterized integral membrane protein
MSNKQQPVPSANDQSADTGHKVNVPALVLAGLLLVIALIFIFSNLDTATLKFLGLSVTMPGWLWFLLLLAVGIVIGSLFPWLRPRKKSAARGR